MPKRTQQLSVAEELDAVIGAEVRSPACPVSSRGLSLMLAGMPRPRHQRSMPRIPHPVCQCRARAQCFDEQFEELSTHPEKKRARGGKRAQQSSTSSGSSRSRKPKERKRSKLATPRWCIPADQLAKLEEIFQGTPSPSFALREQLANKFEATVRQVSIWFRNRRQRVRLAALSGGDPSAALAAAAAKTAKAARARARPPTAPRPAARTAKPATARTKKLSLIHI